MTGERRPTAQAGFTYLGLLLAVALMGAAWGGAAEVWHAARQRDQERELLFIGRQFRQAIGAYYLRSAGPVKRYPGRLEDLLRDPRQPGVQRYLRRLYRDPMAGNADWGLVRAPDGGIMGVYSRSTAAPRKQAGFTGSERGFAGAGQYADWKFIYVPPRLPGPRAAVGSVNNKGGRMP